MVASLFRHDRKAEKIEQEETAPRVLLLAPGTIADLNGENRVTVKIEGQAVSAGTIVAMAADEIGNHGGAAEG